MKDDDDVLEALRQDIVDDIIKGNMTEGKEKDGQAAGEESSDEKDPQDDEGSREKPARPLLYSALSSSREFWNT